MSVDEDRLLLNSALMIPVMVLILVLMGGHILKQSMGVKNRAIEMKVAQYNQETGKFEWTDPNYKYLITGAK